MSDTAISLFAGYVDSSALGAFPPDENNGFNRLDSAMPTTDVARMLAFFQAEFERRGINREFADNIRPIGGPLVEQRAHVPEACDDDVFVDVSGVLHWDAERDARYVYILAEDAANPGIPPNYDLPEGTIWRLDVPFDGEPLATGAVSYGTLPAGVQQKFPVNGAEPSPLVSGQRYYLYVLEDIARVVERCLFTAP